MKNHLIFAGPRASGKSTKVREIASKYKDEEIVRVSYQRDIFRRVDLVECRPNTELIIIEGLYKPRKVDVTNLVRFASEGIRVYTPRLGAETIRPKIIVTCQEAEIDVLKGYESLQEHYELVEFFRDFTSKPEVTSSVTQEVQAEIRRLFKEQPADMVAIMHNVASKECIKNGLESISVKAENFPFEGKRYTATLVVEVEEHSEEPNEEQ